MNNENLFKKINIFWILYVLFHFIPCLYNSPYFWGTDMYAYFTPYISFTIIIFTLFLSINTKSADYFLQFLNKINLIIQNIPSYFYVLLTAILFYLFREKVFLLGDGMLRIRNANYGLLFSTDQPLTTFIHGLIVKITKLNAKTVYQSISILAGIITIIFYTKISNRLFSKTYKKLITGGLLFSSGIIQFYFGYVESYSILALFIFLFLLTALKEIKEQKISYLPAVWLAIAVIFHPSGILFVPALFYLYFYAKDRSLKEKLISLLKVSGIFLVAISFLLGLFYFIGDISPIQFLKSYGRENNIKPLFSNNNFDGILSLSHFIDIFNEILLTVPAITLIVFAALLFLKNRKDKQLLFLLTSLVGPLLFFLTFNPLLGFARDWDIMAIIAYPLTLFISFSILKYSNKKQAIKIGTVTIILSLFHTIPWVLINANQNKSIRRFTIIMNTPHWSKDSKAKARDELSSLFMKQEQYEKAIKYLKEAYNLTYNNRYLFKAGVSSFKIKDYATAGKIFEYLNTQKDSLNFDVPFYLATLYEIAGEYDKALNLYFKALRMDSTKAIAYYCIANIYEKKNNINEAIKYCNIAKEKGYSISEINNLLNKIKVKLKK